MKQLVLLRHGESQWNRENRFTGWTDVELNEKGLQEAIEASATLAGTILLGYGLCSQAVVNPDRKDAAWPPG